MWTSVWRFWLCDSQSAVRRRSSFAVVGTIDKATAALLMGMEFCWTAQVVVVGMGSAAVVGVEVARKARLVFLRVASCNSPFKVFEVSGGSG